MAQYKSKLIILGSGPAGYSAAIYAARSGLKTLLIAGTQKGGQLTITTDVENYPGFPQPIAGPELMERMLQQVLNLGVEVMDDFITEVDFSHKPFTMISEQNSYVADCVIIATGASAKWLGLPNEEKFLGFGVSACATCDGFFFKNQNVAVVGGGNTAAEEALYLANIASAVTIIHRRDELRADKALQNRIFQNPKINIEWDSVVCDVLGKDEPKAVSGVKIRNLKTDRTKNLKVAGLFVAIGHQPNTDIFRNYLQLDKNGYIVTPSGSCRTSVDGVFAAGDVKDPIYRQAITAAGSGCQAFLEAERYLREILA